MSVEAVFQVTESPATPAAIAELQLVCGKLPASYIAFLMESNGAEWGIHDKGGDCLALWSAEEIPKLNEDYGITRWVPELLVIGSDGGGDAIGFDRSVSTDMEHWPIIRIGFGNLDRTDFVCLASGFSDWQSREFRLKKARVS